MTTARDRPLTPLEARWLKRLQRVLAAQPPSLTIYCHGSTATVLDTAAAAADDRTAAIIDDAPAVTTRRWIAGDF